MTVYLSVPVIAAVVGALIYLFANNPKLSELGRLIFAASAFALFFALVRS